jgi:NAD kinase
MKTTCDGKEKKPLLYGTTLEITKVNYSNNLIRKKKPNYKNQTETQ